MRKVRAISPVVAVLLLIIVAVAAVLLIYLWMSGFVGKATRTPAEMKTEFNIEEANITVYKKGTAKKFDVTLWLRNTGTTSLDLSALKEANAVAVYIYDSSTGNLVFANTTIKVLNDNNRNGVWEPGELLEIVAAKGADNSGLIIKGGHYYDVKVVIKGVEAILTYIKAVNATK